MNLRSSSAPGPCSQPSMPSSQNMSTEFLCAVDGSTNSPMTGLQQSPLGVPCFYETQAATSSGIAGTRGSVPSIPYPTPPADVPMMTPAYQPPDDFSWNLANSNTCPLPSPALSQAPPLHSDLSNSRSTHVPQHALQHFMVPPCGIFNGPGCSWSNSPYSSDMRSSFGQCQTPPPPNPPPELVMSSNKGPRQLLVMYTVVLPAALPGALSTWPATSATLVWMDPLGPRCIRPCSVVHTELKLLMWMCGWCPVCLLVVLLKHIQTW
jgi:hypothetical protein